MISLRNFVLFQLSDYKAGSQANAFKAPGVVSLHISGQELSSAQAEVLAGFVM